VAVVCDEKDRFEHLNIATFVPVFAGKEIRVPILLGGSSLHKQNQIRLAGTSSLQRRNAGTESTERHPRLLGFPKERPILIAFGNGQTS
jgi:hypothetical protein